MTNFKTLNEKDNPTWCTFLEGVGVFLRTLGNVVIVGFLCYAMFFAAKTMHQKEFGAGLVPTAHADNAPESLPGPHTEVLNEKTTHYTLEYFKGGIRHVGVIEKGMLELISGTAKDHHVNPSHLIALCSIEGVEYHSGHTFLCSPHATGDRGKAVGAFQIHLGINYNISEEDARHPYFAARWTAERLLRKGYKRNPKYAMQCHNSCGAAGAPYADKAWEVARTLRIIDEVTF